MAQEPAIKLSKRYALHCVFGVALFLISGSSVARAEGDLLRIFDVDGRTLRVPASYLDYDPTATRVNHGLELLALWPSMKGYLLPDGSTPPPDRRPPILSLLTISFVPTAKTAGLTSFLEGITSAYGLTQTGETVSGLRRLIGTKPYILRDKEVLIDSPSNPTAVMICSSPNSNLPRPGCVNRFTYREMFFTVGFARVYLSDWVEIQTQVRRLYSSFLVNNQ